MLIENIKHNPVQSHNLLCVPCVCFDFYLPVLFSAKNSISNWIDHLVSIYIVRLATLTTGSTLECRLRSISLM